MKFFSNLSPRILLFIKILESFFTTWALMKASRMEPGNILTGVFFLLSFFFYRHIHRRLSQKPFANTPCARRTAGILAGLYT